MIQVHQYLDIIKRNQNVAFIIFYENLPQLLFFLILIPVLDKKIVIELIHFLFVVVQSENIILVAPLFHRNVL